MNIRPIVFTALLLAFFVAALPASAQSKPSVDGLAADLASQDARKRIMAAEEIGRRGPSAKQAVPALVEMLGRDDAPSRLAAVQALAKMGEAGAPALPELRKLAVTDPNPNVLRAAGVAAEAIDPSFKSRANKFFESIYFIYSIVALVGLLLVGLVVFKLWQSGREEADESRSKATAKSAAESTAKLSAKPSASSASQPASEAKPAGAEKLAAEERRRVSKPLTARDVPAIDKDVDVDTVKRAFVRAQEDLKKVLDRQVEIGRTLESKEIVANPDRLLELRAENEKLSSEHYYSEVRAKALEVKVLGLLMTGTSATSELRARSEAAFRDKWNDLVALCETPLKISYEGEQWARRPLGERNEIADLRAHLLEYGVTIPDGIAPPGAAPAAEAEAPDVDDAVPAENGARASE